MVYDLAHVRTRRLAPIEVVPHRGGNIIADPKGGTYRILRAAELGPARADEATSRQLRLNHFANCPSAEGFRR